KPPFPVRFEPAGWGAAMEDLHMDGEPSIFVWEVHGEEDLRKKNWSNQFENPQSAHQSGEQIEVISFHQYQV
ncbi:tRNAse Z4, partial [Prunus dulcis]